MGWLLCLVFFLSGAAALLFQTLWFRQAGLAFGNGVWASSLVLAAFMVGLALGNVLAGRIGDRLRRPLHVYAAIEVLIAVTGVALVWILPGLSGFLAPLLASLEEHAAWMNAVRLVAAFALLALPATAMGATLPIVVRVLVARDASFGSALGRLYGWNTLGAVAGALAGELGGIALLGVRGTAWVAGGLDLVAAGAALALSVRLGTDRLPAAPAAGGRIDGVGLRCCAAAFLAGAILLALEVVWFRFLQLFVVSTAVAFAVMLAVVLAGIATGGLAAGFVLRRRPEGHRDVASLALVSGFAVVACYALFAPVVGAYGPRFLHRPLEIFWLSLVLEFPVAFLSGMLFTGIGAALQRRLPSAPRATGLLTFSNTVGAGLGSLCAGFVLLPGLGMDRSFLLLAAAYGPVALLLLGRPTRSWRQPGWIAALALFAAALVFFPRGLIRDRYLETVLARTDPSRTATLEALREGRTETIAYLRTDLLGEPLHHRLVTNGYNMSVTALGARRYMKLYTWWPVALADPPRRALLISYGVGSTAKSLTDTASLEHIDVVDISREILELSELVFPDPSEHPLRDPRVAVHVEDGRWFLETTRERYDLITGEPPPPKAAGIVNLYTREYFQLVRGRLAEGGIHTYWLPVHSLLESDARAIIAAYCRVFEDCSLWVGEGLDWMLVGSRNARWHRSVPGMERPWRDPVVGPELRAVGLEVPEQLGALFLADAGQLAELVGDTPPLTDDFPKRLSDRMVLPGVDAAPFAGWSDPERARRRFEASAFVAAAWPPEMRGRTLPYFELQAMLGGGHLQQRTWSGGRDAARPVYADVYRLLTETSLETLPLLLLGSSPDQRRIVERRAAEDPQVAREQLGNLALFRLADRDYASAAKMLELATIRAPRNAQAHELRAFALCLAGRREDAQRAREQLHRLAGVEADERYWRWLDERCGIDG